MRLALGLTPGAPGTENPTLDLELGFPEERTDVDGRDVAWAGAESCVEVVVEENV
jgi:hypothetical protein